MPDNLRRFEERPAQMRPALHEPDEERSRPAADVDDRACPREIDPLPQRPPEGQRQRRQAAQRGGRLRRIGIAPRGAAPRPAGADNSAVCSSPTRSRRGARASRPCSAAAPRQELPRLRAAAETPVLLREQPRRRQRVEQPRQPVRIDPEPRRQLLRRQRLLGDRGEEVELHPGQQREGGDDPVLKPLDRRRLNGPASGIASLSDSVAEHSTGRPPAATPVASPSPSRPAAVLEPVRPLPHLAEVCACDGADGDSSATSSPPGPR